MIDPLKNLQQEYIQVQSDLKTNVNMVKVYLDHIQDCKNNIETLGKKLTELQQQYLTLTQGIGNEENSLKE
jgi:peptidoglycan hydrolase CwlO-like protein